MKRTYLKPTIEEIKIDCEISLILQSDPAVGPGESMPSPVFGGGFDF